MFSLKKLKDMNTNKEHINIYARYKSQILLLIVLTITITIKTSAFAQESSTQNTKEHKVSNGSKIHELTEGFPIATFSSGGAKESALEYYIKEQNVAGLLVIHNGKIRLERYAMNHSDSNLWSSLSVAKSVTSTLVGIAIKDGYIKSVDDHVTEYLPELKGSAFDSVKVRHLLTMTSGVKWNEKYADPDSDIAGFDKYTTADDMKAIVSYMRRLPAVAEPGKKFNYSTGETHLLGALISAATKQSLSEYLSTKIWIPYGMEQTATWRLDRTNQEMAGCCLQMRLRDFGRFGQFVLEDGYINGEPIVPDDWFKAATKIQMPLWPGGGYGYGWWIFNNHSFEALGIHGQKIYIDPSRKLVIAINSAWPEADSNSRHFAAANFIKLITDEIDKE